MLPTAVSTKEQQHPLPHLPPPPQDDDEHSPTTAPPGEEGIYEKPHNMERTCSDLTPPVSTLTCTHEERRTREGIRHRRLASMVATYMQNEYAHIFLEDYPACYTKTIAILFASLSTNASLLCPGHSLVSCIGIGHTFHYMFSLFCDAYTSMHVFCLL